MVLKIIQKKLVEGYIDGDIISVITKANVSTDVFLFFQKFRNVYFLKELYVTACECRSAIVLCFIMNLQLAENQLQ